MKGKTVIIVIMGIAASLTAAVLFTVRTRGTFYFRYSPGRTATEAPSETQKVSTMEGYHSAYHPAHLSSGEALELARSESGAIVLDLRSEADYSERHVSEALSVPIELLEGYAAANLPDKEQVIICYCFCGEKGGSALSAYDLLTDLGYTAVYYMEPGDDWTYEGTSVKPEHRLVSGEEAMELYGSGALLLDVRSPDEYNAAHIDGSLLIPAAELGDRLSELPEKDALIIVYCKSGMRSAAAYETLSAAGYTNVYDMQSVDSWTAPLIYLSN